MWTIATERGFSMWDVVWFSVYVPSKSSRSVHTCMENGKSSLLHSEVCGCSLVSNVNLIHLSRKNPHRFLVTYYTVRQHSTISKPILG